VAELGFQGHGYRRWLRARRIACFPMLASVASLCLGALRARRHYRARLVSIP
jgi:hypothetical protein